MFYYNVQEIDLIITTIYSNIPLLQTIVQL